MVPVIRLFRFKPARPAFDNVLRDWIVPSLCGQPGIVDVYAGRHGPDELGPRLVVSIWGSLEAMEYAFDVSARPGGLHPERLDGIEDPSVEVLSVEFDHRTGTGAGRPQIVRLFRGIVRPGRFAAYLEETRAGVAADVAAGHGPSAFHLARGGSPDAIVAVSVWRSWAAIEQATGGDIRQPLATRHAELLASFDVTHYEAIDL